ncbi:cupin domain-containing protein [Flavobacterium sp. GT3R68]|uniref:cupin domain-containing protein n=1 Tax=Flavobacterium sp. GT3R68 TaxID=2594437 RepID=UPI000F89D028|nr:cupin domain-containing protein [Flavobacterium sp. GT3R68]RTY95859.1 cupin domain-containing protein [Flavobacterium sp. GSN2]TRW93631.1 cupin domain-containing protein [Flavobacterium sp. GT3R68]
MKKNLILIFRVFCMLLLCSFHAVGQEAKKMNSNMHRDLGDDKLIHAVEVTLEPGQKTDMHTHPANFFYAITDGKLMVHYKNGKDQLYDLKAGESGVSEAEGPHVTENIGSSTIKFLIVELKEHPYKAGNMKK